MTSFLPPSRSTGEPPPSSSPRRRRVAFCLWAAVVSTLALCATILARDVALILEQLTEPPVVIETRAAAVPRPPQEPAAVSPPLALGCNADPQRDRLQELEDQAQELRLRNRHLRKLLERQAAAARYPPPAPAAPQRPPRQRSARRGPLLQASAPAVALIGSDALVTATVRNLSDLDLSPRIEVALLRNGRTVRRRSFSLRVPAGAVAPFAETFPTSLADGTYSATVEIEP